MELSSKILSSITIFMKYARYIPELQRRETWEEIVDRNKAMHIKKFPKLKDEIENAYKLVYEKKVLPSMRSMQFAGKPIEINPARMFNCSFVQVSHPYVFAEIMFLLLSGCFHPDTLVKTKNGDKPIKDITTEDLILTYDESNKSYKWTQPTFAGPTDSINKPKIELQLEDGSIIQCTEDHEFYTINRGWVKAVDLTEMDDIKQFNEKCDDIL